MSEQGTDTQVVHRAYSIIDFDTKALDEETRELRGIASTPTPDRYQDVVEPKGAQYKLPLPLLWQHSVREPVGHVTAAKVTKDGIEVVMRMAQVEEPGTLKDRLDDAWQSVKAKLVRGLSIGFRSLESSFIAETGGMHFLRWDWVELSLVTIPANAEAGILGAKSIEDRVAYIKRLDREQRAASGSIIRPPVRLITPRVRGSSKDGSVKLIRRS